MPEGPSLTTRAMTYTLLGKLLEEAWYDATVLASHAASREVTGALVVAALKREVVDPEGACAKLRPVLECVLSETDPASAGVTPEQLDYAAVAARDFDTCKMAVVQGWEPSLRATIVCVAVDRAMRRAAAAPDDTPLDFQAVLRAHVEASDGGQWPGDEEEGTEEETDTEEDDATEEGDDATEEDEDAQEDEAAYAQGLVGRKRPRPDGTCECPICDAVGRSARQWEGWTPATPLEQIAADAVLQASQVIS